MVRAIRGATTINENSADEIYTATTELLEEMTVQNGIEPDDIVSIIFSVTSDLNAAFPAVAARQMGWTKTAMMCTYEIDVPGSLKKCIRVMMHIQSEKGNDELKYVYLREAKRLRPDLAQ
ncbi:MAG: chorismate mutase [Clostridiaceae bacterium]|nr:chorismate mutase [Clostridiaceae bacterium]